MQLEGIKHTWYTSRKAHLDVAGRGVRAAHVLEHEVVLQTEAGTDRGDAVIQWPQVDIIYLSMHLTINTYMHIQSYS